MNERHPGKQASVVDRGRSALYGFDAYAPAEIAERVQVVGVAKAHLSLLSMGMLGVLAGAFIGLGAMAYVLITSDASLGFAGGRMLGGLAFSLGLILVVVAGAELFTGNNLLAMAWADGRISSGDLLRNWLLVGLANFLGAAGLAVVVYLARHAELNDGLVAENYLKIAAAKCQLPFWTAFFRGLLCNVLVCMAVWMAMAGRSVIDKAVAIVFPVCVFVAAGFEHSIANMYLIPLALLLQWSGEYTAAVGLDLTGFTHNLLAVVLGNLVGGSVLVGLVYHVIYRRAARVLVAGTASAGSEQTE